MGQVPLPYQAGARGWRRGPGRRRALFRPPGSGCWQGRRSTSAAHS